MTSSYSGSPTSLPTYCSSPPLTFSSTPSPFPSCLLPISFSEEGWVSMACCRFCSALAVLTRCFYRAMLCIRGTSNGPVSVSVCLSVISRCSTKTAKRRITQTTPYDSPGTLVFWRQRSPRNSTGVGAPKSYSTLIETMRLYCSVFEI